MRLIHCADLHLDSGMERTLPQEKAAERSNELRMTFSRLVRAAREQQVRAVLICGDLFDGSRVTALTEQLVLEEIRNAPEVDFLYLRGNHDEAAAALRGQSLPENLKLFSDTWQEYRYEGVSVFGAELCAGNGYAPYESLITEPERTNIVMLHGQTASAPGEDCVALPLLREKNIDYLALGHIHSFSGGRLDARGSWVYAGCLEGRGFDECGKKGYVLLETTPSGGLQGTFVPFASRTLETVQVPLSGGEGYAELRDKVFAATAAIPETALVKAVLTGSCTPDTGKELKLLTQEIQSRFWFARVADETVLQVHPEDYAGDVSLKGAFVRLVLEQEAPGRQQEEILRLGLQALRGEAISL